VKDVVIFAGPTISADEVEAELDASVLPPVAQGDVYRVARQRPRAMGIIDGYFNRVPSVWHKEILWAISHGIFVFGAASMGALRAVELAPFGMIGVGTIFRAFMDRELEDDDEVAVAHRSSGDGFRPLSEAMVNIRATVESARSEGVIDHALGEHLLAIAKQLDYPERRYPHIARLAAAGGASAAELGRFESWLPRGAVNQKRIDARDMLRAMRRVLADPPSLTADYTFEHTEAWEAATSRAKEQTDNTAERTAMLEEIQVRGAYAALSSRAFARALSLLASRRLGGHADTQAALRAAAFFRAERGLVDHDGFCLWLEKAGLAGAGIEAFFRDVADAERVRSMHTPEIAEQLVECLREDGLYAEYASRAAKKQEALAQAFADAPALADAGLTEDELWRWYFRDVLELPVPEAIGDFARSQGYADVDSFRAAVLRERCFRSL
jgi:hypothetical protein